MGLGEHVMIESSRVIYSRQQFPQSHSPWRLCLNAAGRGSHSVISNLVTPVNPYTTPDTLTRGSQSLQQVHVCQLLKSKQESGLCLKGQGQALSHEPDEGGVAAHEKEENLCIDGRASRPGGSSGLQGSACR